MQNNTPDAPTPAGVDEPDSLAPDLEARTADRSLARGPNSAAHCMLCALQISCGWLNGLPLRWGLSPLVGGVFFWVSKKCRPQGASLRPTVFRRPFFCLKNEPGGLFYQLLSVVEDKCNQLSLLKPNSHRITKPLPTNFKRQFFHVW